MLTHLVLFKFKDPSDENLAAAQTMIQNLEGKIPSLRKMEVGRDVIRAERSYHLGLVARFDDLEGLQAYQVHPEHRPVLAKMKALSAEIAAVDFEL